MGLFWVRQRMQRTGAKVALKASTSQTALSIEPLEPRILLSADPLAAALAAQQHADATPALMAHAALAKGDKIAPKLTLALAHDTGRVGDKITTDARVKGSAKDASGIAKLVGGFEKIKSKSYVDVKSALRANGNLDITATLLKKLNGGKPLAEGKHTLTLKATDKSGNSTTRTLTFTLDSSAPVVKLVLANDAGSSRTDGLTSDAGLFGTVKDVGGVAALKLGVDGAAPANYVNILTSLKNGILSLSAEQVKAIAGGSLADGAHTLTVVATDKFGKQSTARLAFTLNTVTKAPAFNLDAASDTGVLNDFKTTASVVTLVGQAEAGATVALAGLNKTAVADANGKFQFTNVSLPEKTTAFTATATNKAGAAQSFKILVTRASTSAAGELLLTWNQLALDAIRDNAFPPPVATRALAIESLAVFDTLNAINGTPAYLVGMTAQAGTSAEAAVATAAYEALSYLFPKERTKLAAQYAAAMKGIPDGAGKQAGVTLGKAVADKVIALRLYDGAEDFLTREGGSKPGAWRPTAPMYDSGLLPQWATLDPFLIDSATQFRPGTPPALDSAAYAKDVNETRELGAHDSKTRTAEQTQIARFWADGSGTYTPPGHWNQIASELASNKNMNLADTAKLMAMLNLGLADTAIACWDTKYHYDLWRPETAIAHADEDGNAATTADPNWRPLLITPPFPEYTSGHSTFSAAAATILESVFGDKTGFEIASPSLAGVTRSFASFDAAAKEAGRSRIYGGIHYEFSNQAGQAMGRKLGDVVVQSFNAKTEAQGPRIALTLPETGTVTNQKAYAIAGQVLDLSGVKTLAVKIDGGGAQAVTFDQKGNFSLTLAGLPDGLHSFAFTATDTKGNASPVRTASVQLDTTAPQLVLSSLQNNAVLSSTQRLTGSVGSGGTAGAPIAALSYWFDSGKPVPVSFDAKTGAFDTALDLSKLTIGQHVLHVSATDAAGNASALTYTVALNSLIPLTVASLTPAAGATDVGATFRPEVTFSRPIDTATLTANSFYATDASGQKIAATIVPYADKTGAFLLFAKPLPSASSVTLNLAGDAIKAADGRALDADGDGTAGGSLKRTFTTVSTTGVTGTSITGTVVDPGTDLTPMTYDDIRAGADGVLHTKDDVFLNPIAHAKVYVLGQEDKFVYTDAQGRFTLPDTPSGNVKLAVDGRTATNAPSGVFFPEMVLDLQVRPGVANTAMGSMGTVAEQLANADRSEIYLPRVVQSALQSVSTTQATTVKVDAAAAPDLTDAERAQMQLVVQPGSLIGADGKAVQNAKVGLSTVPAELVRDMLPPGVMQHTFDITIQAPDTAVLTTPAQLTMPNVFNLKPGEKTFLLSFDHTTGRLVIDGTMTVSADGKSVTTDPGQGVTKPGWHGMTPPGVNVTPTVTAPPPPPTNPPPPPCDPVGVGLSAAGTALGLAGLALTTVGATPLLVGIGAAGVAVSVIDLARSYGGNTNASNAEGLAGIFAGIVGIGATVQPNNPITVTTITGVGPSAGTITQTVGSTPSLIVKYGGGALGVIGTALSVRDLYNRGEACGLWGGGGSANLQAQNSNLSQQLRAAAASQGISLADAGARLNAFIDAQAAAAKLVDSAFNKIFGTTIAKYLPAGIKESLIVVDSNIAKLVSIETGDFIKNADGTDFQLDLKKVFSEFKFDSSFSNNMQALASAVNKLSESYKNLEVIKPYTDIILKAYADSKKAGSSSAISEDMYYVVRDAVSNEVISRGKTSNSSLNVFLQSNKTYIVDAYAPSSDSYSRCTLTTGESGSSDYSINGQSAGSIDMGWTTASYNDSDKDGLSDYAEFIIGTDPKNFSTAGSGISDQAALKQGIDPLDNRLAATGVVGSVTLQGEAQNVILTGTLTDASKQTAFVATGTYGLAIVDATSALKPTVLSQLKLDGESTDLDVDSVLSRAAVATGTGLAIVNVATPTVPKLVQTVAVKATQVEVFEGIAYANDGGVLKAVDLSTGDVLQSLSLGNAAITGLAREGTTLYATDANGTLQVIDLSRGTMMLKGALSGLPSGEGKLFVADGVAYLGAADGFNGGYATVDVGDPAAPKLISGPDATNIAGTAIAVNGSGLGVIVGNPGGVFGNNTLDVVNTADPSRTDQFITRIALPESPNGVAIGGGIAFVADGASGLQVVNYKAFDTAGKAPTIAITQGLVDIDPKTAGVQVQEGQTVRLKAKVADDVQVRSIEVLVNGKAVSNDISAPFDLSALLPTIKANGSNQITLQVRATDTGGNVTLSPAMAAQLVPDIVPPTLVAQNVSEGAVKGSSFRAFTFGFSEALDPSSVTADTFRLIGPSGQALTPTAIQLRDGGKTVQVTYDPLKVNGSYQVQVDKSVADRAGNQIGTQISTRFTIANYSKQWVGKSGGSWSNAANWSDGKVPAADDDVFINLGADQTITFEAGKPVKVASLNTAAALSLGYRTALTIDGSATLGQVSLEDGATFTANGQTIVSKLTLQDATLAGKGDVTVTGTLITHGSSMMGTGKTIVAKGATMAIDNDYDSLSLGRELDVFGQARIGANSYLFLGGYDGVTDTRVSGKLVIGAGGTLDLADTAAINDDYEHRGTLQNAGTISMSGTGRAEIETNVSNAGTISLVGGAELGLGGTTTLAATSKVTGAGNLVVTGEMKTDTAQSFANLTLRNGLLSGKGDVTITGTLKVEAGKMLGAGKTIVAKGATMTNGDNYYGLYLGRELDLAGKATFDNSHAFYLGAYDEVTETHVAGKLVVTADGSLSLTDGASIRNNGTDTGLLQNAGTISVTGATAIDTNLTNTGTITIASGAELGLGGTASLAATSKVTGTGTLSVRGTLTTDTAQSFANLSMDGGTLTGKGDVTVTGTLALHSGGGMLGTGKTIVAKTATMTNDDNYYGLYLGRELDLAGKASLTGNGYGLILGNYDPATQTEVAGKLVITADGSLSLADGTRVQGYNGQSGSLQNAGTISVTGAATIDTNFTNTGTITIASGAELGFGGTATLAATSKVTGAGTVSVHGTLTTDTAQSLANLTMDGGTLTGKGDVTVTGKLALHGGGMLGTGKTIVAKTATMTNDDNYYGLNLGRELDLAGKASLTGNGYALNLGNYDPVTQTYVAGKLVITADGSLSLADEAYIRNYNNDTGSLQNAGTISVTGRATIDTNFTNTGTLTIASGAELDLGGTITLSGTSKVTGTGALSIRGTLTTSTAQSLSSLGTVSVSGTLVTDAAQSLANLSMEGGTLTGKGDVTVTGKLALHGGGMLGTGKTIVAKTATMTNDDNYYGLNLGRELDLAGKASLTGNGYALNLGNYDPVTQTYVAGKLVITADGSLSLADEAYIRNYNNDTGSLQNAGTISVTGRATIDTNFTNTGTLTIASGAELDLGGTATLAATSKVTGTGTLSVRGTLTTDTAQSLTNLSMDGGTLTGKGDVTITGKLALHSGGMLGTGKTIVAKTATMTNDDNYYGISLGRQLDLAGKASLSGNGYALDLSCYDPATQTYVPGKLVVTADGSLSLAEGTYIRNNGTDAGSLQNAGTISVTGNATIEPNLTNTGTITVGAGTLNLGRAFTNAGTVSVAAGAEFVINGDFTQAGNAVLKLGLAPAGTAKVTADGTAKLAGTLTFLPATTFAPSPGQTFAILTAYSRSGQFGSVTGTATSNGRTLSLVTADPETLSVKAG